MYKKEEEKEMQSFVYVSFVVGWNILKEKFFSFFLRLLYFGMEVDLVNQDFLHEQIKEKKNAN